ncbi:MAG: type I-U CRISPR-associated protein Csx17 [Vicinamibacterales bacterium]
MPEIVLGGCTTTPLAGYLKGLGVLRLVSQRDPGARGAWRGRTMVLWTSLSEEDLDRFFVEDYRPTPVIAPWNGGSGFYENDNTTALDALRASHDSRLAAYREALARAEVTLRGIDRRSSPKDTAKVALLKRLRGSLPEDALEWFDASVVLSGDAAQYPPLLGTGGNDGRLDFTNNFMQRLVEVFGLSSAGRAQSSGHWLRLSLRGEPAPGLIGKAIGQFSPGQAGGPNASSGFSGDALVNPWDFVLMIEGALPFAAAAVRRNADDPDGVLGYPFTVRAVGAGAGNLGEADGRSSRGELWMPLWRQPASYHEVRALLGEGRVALGRKPARDALDFVRAVQHLAGYRGVDRFQRYGLLMRSGKAYLATPLAELTVSRVPVRSLIDELDEREWLTRFRRFAQGENAAARFKRLRRRLEDAVFEFAGREPEPLEVQGLLTLLGEVQSALAQSRTAREEVAPVPRLSERWVTTADDGTAAFRIARALAGLGGYSKALLPIRAQLFPIDARRNEWLEAAKKAPGPPSGDPASHLRIHRVAPGNLTTTLVDLLERRLWLGEQLGLPDKPLDGPAGVDLDDVAVFLSSTAADTRIVGLLRGLSLCRIPGDTERLAGATAVPAAFALLKLCLTPDSVLHSLRLLRDDSRLPVAAGLVAQLAAGNAGNRAVRLAWRRLRASGLSPRFDGAALPVLAGIAPGRAAAALLIPLRFGAVGALAREVLAVGNDSAA